MVVAGQHVEADAFQGVIKGLGGGADQAPVRGGSGLVGPVGGLAGAVGGVRAVAPGAQPVLEDRVVVRS
ncbi:hypothetical protein E6W39_19790 [Kitasatospora acidiphila]|uniref:Uncharacterized protein n=1 Tax=Kitasatospora acidiphila TaxID=2567942 RepID=A0A540W4Z6_9ACTN|nr:hypothetical protein [Kitasatospora acidiphila]TQF04062.1 hypothetical protein E6W39_19790 [Kitasatospora acidiphila]